MPAGDTRKPGPSNDASDQPRSAADGGGSGNSLGIAGRIAAFFIDSPLTPLLLLATLGIGVLGLLTPPRQEDPDISVPMIDIQLRYPGGSAEQVARLAVQPLERVMSELDRVEHVYSVSRREQGLVTVRFEVGTPIEPAVVAVHDTIESNLGLVPPDVTEWLVRPKTIRLLWAVLIGVLALVTLADFLVHGHPHFGIDGTFGFFSWYGFATCVAMVLLAKLLGIFLKRPETYYDR